MKVLGITAEYNPFHRGHAYQMKEAIGKTKAEYTVIAMSGNFTQRGEPAIMDKWKRSECAVKSGADLVIEIPFRYSCSWAEDYAKAAVDLLISCGVTHISFGCETDDHDALRKLAGFLLDEADLIEQNMKVVMKEGYSSAKARELVVEEQLGRAYCDLMTLPNNILALEYLKRIRYWNLRGRSIEDVPITRKGSGYFEINPQNGYAGASEIRRVFFDPERKDGYAGIAPFVPEETIQALRDFYGNASPAICNTRRKSQCFELLRYELIRSDANDLANMFHIGEGIENRMKKAAMSCGSLTELLQEVTSKRYPSAAVRRMFLYILMGIKKNADSDQTGPEYIRVLAAGENGRRLLKIGKKQELFSLPVIININKSDCYRDLTLECKATDLYNMINGRNLYECSDHVKTPYIATT